VVSEDEALMSGATSPSVQEQQAVAELAARGFEWECDVWGWGYHHLDDAALVLVKRLGTIAFLDLFEVCDEGGVSDDGLASLVGTKSLICLRLGPGITDAGLAHLVTLTQLIELRLDSAEDITDAGMKYVSMLANLETLSVQFTQVGDSGLAELSRLSRLKHLEINNTQITENGLGHVARMTALTSLTLSTFSVGRNAAAALKAVLPNCQVHEY